MYLGEVTGLDARFFISNRGLGKIITSGN